MFKLSNDSKVKFYTSQKNSIGFLPGPPRQGGTCPGCTEGVGGCWVSKPGKILKTCYVTNSMNRHRGVHNVLTYNTELLRASSVVKRFNLFRDAFKEFSSKCDKYAEKNKIEASSIKKFRLYWAGDINDQLTAKALNAAMTECPDIIFWTYTRSLDWVHLLNAPNLKLYISVDAVNEKEALQVYNKLKDTQPVNLAYLSKLPPKISGIGFLDCPADSGIIHHDMACKRCRLCTTGGNNIWFKER